MELNSEKLKEVLIELGKKEVKCPACGKYNFSYTKGETHLLSLSREGDVLSLDENISFIPSLALICKECGYISLFSPSEILGESHS